MLDEGSGAVVAVKAFGTIQPYLRDDAVPVGQRPSSSQANQRKTISAALGPGLGIWTPDEQHPAIYGRPPRALRFELVMLGPKGFAHGCLGVGAR